MWGQLRPGIVARLNDICNISVDTNSGIETITIDDIRVVIDGMNVSIESIINSSATMFSIDGISIPVKYSDGKITLFEAPTYGYYILCLGKIALKIKV